jgi:putative flippase GtrA
MHLEHHVVHSTNTGRFARIRHFFQEPFFFALSSFLSWAFDYTFYLALSLTVGLQSTLSYFIARFFSSILNFLLNRQIVFKQKGGPSSFWQSLIQYFALAGFILLLGSSIMTVYTEIFAVPGWIAKPVIDLSLFGVSFFVQRELIFRRGRA